MQLLAFLAMLCVGVLADESESPKVIGSLRADSPNLFIKPIMYGTALVLVAIIFGSTYCVYRMSDDKDPLIYSKFLSNKKKNT